LEVFRRTDINCRRKRIQIIINKKQLKNENKITFVIPEFNNNYNKMKKIIKNVVLLISIFTLINCSKSEDNSNSNSTSNLIVGKWQKYKTIFIADNNTYLDDCLVKQCFTYEFKENGTCISNEKGTITSYIYKIEGDFLQFYNPASNLLVDSDIIVSITNTDLSLNIDENDNIDPSSKRQWVFRRY